jgi:nicotinate phosphoribosyltransferase
MACALLIDLYELTMAQAWLRAGRADDEAVFVLSFRTQPFGGGYAVACGLADVIDRLRAWRFTSAELVYLESLRSPDGGPLFDGHFLRWLSELRLSLDVDAIPEGTAVFAFEPLVRVRGPVAQGQLVEGALLNAMNYATLAASKAARVCEAAAGEPVLEFGMRRAQGADGALTASRAAFVGGCAATSNVLAGLRFGIPVRGTHAHSWVMAFDSERESFRRYAEAMPHNTVFLVDTYDSLDGVRTAIEVGREMRARGQRLGGIRLDSGDLAWLSLEARRLLDEAGFTDAAVLASNDLDEFLIESLKHQGARIGIWGVGTRLVTGGGQGALDGVYKLSAIRTGDGPWRHRVKLSEQAGKISIPGVQQVRRFRDADTQAFVADAIFDEEHPPGAAVTIVDPLDPTRRKHLVDLPGEELLRPVFRAGQLVYQIPPLALSRARTFEQLAALPSWCKRLQNPHSYPVGLEAGLADLRTRLIVDERAQRVR